MYYESDSYEAHDSLKSVCWWFRRKAAMAPVRARLTRDMADSYTYVYMFKKTWLIRICDLAHSYVWHESFLCRTWLIHIHVYTCSRWHDSFRYVTWLIHMCDMNHFYAGHDPLTCAIWLIRMRDMTHPYLFAGTFEGRRSWPPFTHQTHDMTHVYEGHDVFMYSLLHLVWYFSTLTTQSIIYFSASLSPRSVETRPIRFRLENEMEWHAACTRLYNTADSYTLDIDEACPRYEWVRSQTRETWLSACTTRCRLAETQRMP